MIGEFINLGLLISFGANILSAAAYDFLSNRWKAAGISNHDLWRALCSSYEDALEAIQFGFRQNTGLIDKVGKRRLYRDITYNFNIEFILPFAKENKLDPDELRELASASSGYCRQLRDAIEQVIPRDQVLSLDIEDILLTGRNLTNANDVQQLNEKVKRELLDKVRSVEGIPSLFTDLLAYKDLLMGTIVFFFNEKIKSDERVRSILTHNELQRIREESHRAHQKEMVKIDTTMQMQMTRFEQCIGPINDNLAEVFDCLQRLESEMMDTTKYLEKIWNALSQDRNLSERKKSHLKAGLSPTLDLHTKYEFDETKPIGYGAVAVVYKALHRGLNQVRAIKLLKPEHKENQEIIERFLREGIILGELKHPNIIQIYDVGGGGTNLDFYLDMEYIDGNTLRNFTKTKEPDWERTLKFIRQLGSAIQIMHEKGIIHRDINSRNIMVSNEGDLKLMDFGVAKIIGLDGLTRDGQVLGSTYYMAPEQARGERVDERADIYSFGVLMYELCTKRLPAIPPLPVRQYQVNLPEWIEGIVDRCLKQDKELRYANMKDLMNAIEAGNKRPTVAIKPQSTEISAAPHQKSEMTETIPGKALVKRRTKGWIIAVTGFISLLLIGFVVMNFYKPGETITNSNFGDNKTASVSQDERLKVARTPNPATPGLLNWKLETGDDISGIYLSEGMLYAYGTHGVYAIDAITGDLRWSFDKEGEAWALEIINGIIYMGRNDGLYALDAITGKQKGKFSTNSAITRVDAQGDTIITGTYDSIYALDRQTLNENWNFRITRKVTLPVIQSESTVYFIQGDWNDPPEYGKLYALNKLTGAPKWSFVTEKWHLMLTFENGIIYAGNSDGLYALDAESGKQLWKFPGVYMGNAHLYDNKVLTSAKGNIIALDNATGRLIWEYKSQGFIGISIYGDTVYYSSENMIYAIDSNTGSLKRKYEGGTNARILEIDNSIMYVSTNQGINALNINNGQTVWVFNSSNPKETRFAYQIISSDKLVYTQDGKTIYSIFAGQ